MSKQKICRRLCGGKFKKASSQASPCLFILPADGFYRLWFSRVKPNVY